MKIVIYVICLVTSVKILRAQSFTEVNLSDEQALNKVIDASKADQSRTKTFFALLKLGAVYLNENQIPKCDSVLTIVENDFHDLITQGVHWRSLNLSNYYMLLSALYFEKNDNSKSKAFLDKAHQINSDVFSYANNLYKLYIREGKLDSAELYLQRTFPLLAKNLDIDKLDYALLENFDNVFKNMCQLKIMRGDHEGFEFYLSKWTEISKGKLRRQPGLRKKKLDKLSPWQMIYLSKYYTLSRNFKNARDVLKYASKAKVDDRLKLETLRSWAQYYYTTDNIDSTIYFMKSVIMLHKENMKVFFPFFTEVERENYVSELNDDYDFLLSVITENDGVDKNNITDLFEFQIFRKGLLLDITKKLNKITTSLHDDQVGKLVADIASIDDSIAQVTFKKSGLFVKYDKEAILNGLYRRKDTKEKKLLRLVSKVSESLFDKIAVYDITEALDSGSCLVEIIRFGKWGKDFKRILSKGAVFYAAIIVSKQDAPKIIVIPSGDQLEGRYAHLYKNSIQMQIDDKWSNDVYWLKIHEQIKDYKKIFLSPDGIYNVINVVTLHNPITSQFVLDETELINITSPKDLVQHSKGNEIGNSALLVGYPLYSFNETEAHSQEKGTRGAVLESLENIKSESFNPLPATKGEVETIGNMIKDKNGTYNLLEGKNATESNIKSAKIPDILHIATHGFFVGSESNMTNPLLKSGLVLAGVNNNMLDDNTNEDGILTAFEITSLDLKKTKLVVLSACETGLGDVRNGDGVYGLQRAFKIAEAEYLILSMWKVDDAATMKLMTLFYTSLLNTGNVVESFNAAQKELRKIYPSPYYWGAFKLIGY